MISNTGKLAGRTLFITGASRGIGKAIALKAARDGANIVVAAKTATAHPKLPGTIYSAAEEIEKAGGKALPCIVDIRNEEQVKDAVAQAVNKFGGIDILVNNASAISLTPTENTDMKKFDLMHQINTRGTFLVSKECLPHIQKSSHGHILNISPPLNMDPDWFRDHVAYTMAKYGMSMCVLGMAREYQNKNISVNALWPRTAIYTAAMEMLAGDSAAEVSRVPEIMADAAYVVLSQTPLKTTGKFLIDDEVLAEAGVTDFKHYAIKPENSDKLMPDFFLGTNANTVVTPVGSSGGSSSGSVDFSGKIGHLFQVINANLGPEIVQSTNAIYQFEVTGSEKSTWHLNLKEGAGSVGRGPPTKQKADAVLTMDTDNFLKMFGGQLKPAVAYMMGKLKISGDLQKAMKLEKLMAKLKSKL
ncbi:hydroxysteroid dehydrogenase-like protein 2 [Ctenocephalides felis]|uniref:hydroxysteroid dehydrogenase-like protein 2 n=1 Tax=Ctenocephalides felis TaxID=7515 RepID=UPI000E6E33DA|nr:hydroxysteroid dehydrogenase-like protein 2 [Ctenocephalides felis]